MAELDALGFMPKKKNGAKSLRAWKHDGVLYLVVNTLSMSYGFFLSRDHVVMLLERLVSIANLHEFGKVYRVSGQCGRDPLDLSEPISRLESYLSRTILASFPDEPVQLAKTMKTTLAYLENNFHGHAVQLDTGEERRGNLIKEQLIELGDESLEFYNLLISLRVTDRTVLDLAYIFHLLPTPDRDIVKLVNNTIEKMNAPRKCNQETVDEFISFCELMDYVKVYAKERKQPNCVYVNEGRESAAGLEELRRLEKYAAQGRVATPGPEALNIVKISKHFQYVPYSRVAHLGAKDVTRIPASAKEYFNTSSNNRARMIDSNELLSSLIKGKYVHKGLTMDQYKEALINGTAEVDNIADITDKGGEMEAGVKKDLEPKGDFLCGSILERDDGRCRSV